MEDAKIEELKRALDEALQIAALLQMKLDQALEAKKQSALKDVIATMEKAGIQLGDIAEHLGLKVVSPLTEESAKADKTPSVPRYRNPDDPRKTWSGQGGEAVVPEWIKDYRLPGEGKRRFMIDVWNPEHPEYGAEKRRQEREAAEAKAA